MSMLARVSQQSSNLSVHKRQKEAVLRKRSSSSGASTLPLLRSTKEANLKPEQFASSVAQQTPLASTPILQLKNSIRNGIFERTVTFKDEWQPPAILTKGVPDEPRLGGQGSELGSPFSLV